MKTYEYKGFHRNGRPAKGLVEALSPKEAREKLSAGGVLAERVSATGRQVRFPAGMRATIYRELGALLGAGLPLLRALEVLIQSPELGDSRVLLAGIRDSVREGAPLARAVRDASRSVSSFEFAIIEAAERSATVESMLNELAAFLEDREKLRERVQGALVYPAIVFTVGVCVAIVMLGVLLPRARDLLAGSTAPMPKLTLFMIGLGQFLFHWGIGVLVVLGAAGAWAWRRYRKSEELRLRVSRLLFRVPVAGRGHTILVNLRFARTMAILLRGGVPLIDAVVLSGRATGSAWVAGLAAGAAETVRHGGRFSDAVRSIPPLSETLPGWIEVGEASGGVSDLLLRAGQRYQDYWDRYVRRSLSVIEPMLILLIGGFVLLVTLSVLLPVISMSHAIGP